MPRIRDASLRDASESFPPDGVARSALEGLRSGAVEDCLARFARVYRLVDRFAPSGFPSAAVPRLGAFRTRADRLYREVLIFQSAASRASRHPSASPSRVFSCKGATRLERKRGRGSSQGHDVPPAPKRAVCRRSTRFRVALRNYRVSERVFGYRASTRLEF